MSKKRIKAVRMWADYDFGINDHAFDMVSLKNTSGLNKPIIVLPATAEAYEQMLQQMHDAYSHRPPGNNPNLGLPSENRMRAALRAIGITPPKKAKP